MAKVLLVEDDNNLREIYQARLQAEGYTIVAARDGEEALVVAKAEKPNLIIADVMMPKISGFEMLDIVRNTDSLKTVKVIMLTALGQSEDQKRADKLGADRYLVKSQVTLEDIVKAARELLGEGAAEQAPAASTPAPAAPPAEPAPTASPQTSDKAEVAAPAKPPTPAEPTPAPAAPETPAAADTKVNNTAESAKQEAATAEVKIEDFVAGATSEPTTPTGVPAKPAEDTAPAPPAEAATQAADDKLLSDAADTLNASAEAEAAPVTQTAPSAPKVIPVNQPVDDTTAAPAPAPKAFEKKTSVGGQRVIQPIDSEPKKDLNALLAEEEAKSPSTPTPGSVTPTSTINPTDAPKDGPVVGAA